MGEIAEMMLDGTLCEGCGEYLEGGGDGIPRYCSPECAHGRGMEYIDPVRQTSPNAKRANKQNAQRMDPRKTFPCPVCSRLFRSTLAAEQHAMDKHTGALAG